MSSFGEVICQTRKGKLLSQRELAARIKKEDGQPISPQYLNDIERNRRNPPSEDLIRQLANELGLDAEYMCLLAGTLPQDVMGSISEAEPKRVSEAFRHFRQQLQRKK